MQRYRPLQLILIVFLFQAIYQFHRAEAQDFETSSPPPQTTRSLNSQDPAYKRELEDILFEYDNRKAKIYRERFCRNQDLVNRKKPYQRICPELNPHYMKFYLSLFAIISLGALTRTILKVFAINIPYTVILMVFGIGLGFITWNRRACEVWSMYTRIARTPPKIILDVFLPVLIFESAFAMKAHVFFRSSISIMILAFPGMVICTFVTAFVCNQFFYAYKWNFMDASLYGSIISATDPVAVVAILKESGTSEMLSILIEGESLLNDGTAILFYEIFLDIVAPEQGTAAPTTGGIILQLCRIAIGGPLFGWVMARLSIFFLSRIFNDAPVEVSITLVAAYLTYYVGEAYLGVSGVMAVVALGIVMSAERTCISPEVQGLVHHFWEMLGYLANTVLFVLVGVVISETALNNVTLEDGYYLIFLYFALNISRFLMIVMLSPILTHVGYGLTWQNLLVMTWGGLRGAVGISLALEVFKNRELCERPEMGPKFLLQTAGIVILTLLVNGTTTKLLLNMLKLSELSIGKIQDMNNAVRHVEAAQQRAIAAMKHDRLLGDCNFDCVERYTALSNPYAKHKIKTQRKYGNDTDDDVEKTPSLLVDVEDERIVHCPDCDGEVPVEPNLEEYKEITEESRLRLLKALKVSCWRQYEQGLLTEDAVHFLVEYFDQLEDQQFKMFHAIDLKKNWQVRGCIAWMRNKLLPYTVGFLDDDDFPPEPENSAFRTLCYRIVTNDWFDGIIHIIILFNLIPIVWETVDIIKDHAFTYHEIVGFLITNIVFTSFLATEFTLKVTAFGCGGYWSSKWNILDALVLFVSIIEISLSISNWAKIKEEANGENTTHEANADLEFLKFMRFIRVLRIVRIVRLFRPLVPRFMDYLNGKVNRVLFLGYDMAKGSASAIDDVLKFLPQMIENKKVHERFKMILEEQRLFLLLEMGLLQKDHPGIAVAIKTRHANRAVLNGMRYVLNELKEDGLLDQRQYEVLLKEIEGKMKGLWHTPSYITPRRAEMIMADLQWISGNTDLLAYLIEKATVLQYAVGDTVFSAGDDSNGLYIIISGVVRISYKASYELIRLREKLGIIPNADIFENPTFETEMTDYYTTSAVLGELGVLTGAPYASTVTCETSVSVYHVSNSVIEAAMDSFDDRYDSLEGRLWRTFGMKLAASVLPNQPAYQAWTVDKIKAHLERSAVPIGDQYLTINFPSFVTDVVLIYGQIVDAHEPTDVYTAPCLVPASVTKIKPIPNWKVRPRVLIIANEEVENEPPTDDETKRESPSTSDLRQYIVDASKPATIREDQLKRISRPSTYGVGGRRSGMSSRTTRTGITEASSDSSRMTRFRGGRRGGDGSSAA